MKDANTMFRYYATRSHSEVRHKYGYHLIWHDLVVDRARHYKILSKLKLECEGRKMDKIPKGISSQRFYFESLISNLILFSHPHPPPPPPPSSPLQKCYCIIHGKRSSMFRCLRVKMGFEWCILSISCCL